MEELNLPKKRIIVTDASGFRRSLAFAVDILIIYLLLFPPLGTVLLTRMPDSMTLDEQFAYFEANPSLINSITAILSLLAFTYFVLFEYLLGQSPGKMIFKLHVKSVTKHPLTLSQCLLRGIFLLPITWLSFIAIVDVVHMIFKKVRFTDVLVNSRVVEVYKV